MTPRKFKLIATCVLAVSGSAYVHAQGDGQQGNSQQQKTQSVESKAGVSQPDIRTMPVETQRSNEGPVNSDFHKPDCQKPKNAAEADLCVQLRVAAAAENALHWSKLQTYGALGGLLLVLATLIATASSSRAARISAEAAVDAVNVANQSLRSDRPWILPMTAKSIVNDKFDEATRTCELIDVGAAVQWYNFGKNPATNVNIITVSYVNDVGVLPDAPIPDKAPSPENAGVQAPGSNSYSTTEWLGVFNVTDFTADKLAFYIFSQATYTDPFTKCNHITKVAYKIEFGGYTMEGDGRPKANIIIRAYGSHTEVT